MNNEETSSNIEFLKKLKEFDRIVCTGCEEEIPIGENFHYGLDNNEKEEYGFCDVLCDSCYHLMKWDDVEFGVDRLVEGLFPSSEDFQHNVGMAQKLMDIAEIINRYASNLLVQNPEFHKHFTDQGGKIATLVIPS